MQTRRKLYSAFRVRAPGLAALIWRKLAPYIYVVLVHELDGMVASVSASQREQTGKTIGELFKIADANFVRAWGEQRFNAGFGVGNDGVKFGGAEGSWLAPSLVLSKFFLERATARLGTRDVLIAIPNQERILAFPNAPSSANSLRLATMVRDGFASHPRPVSARVFRWRGPGRLEPIAFRWLV